MDNKPKIMNNKVIANGHFEFVKKIGEGSFGQVYVANDLHRPGKQVAIKTESVMCRFPQLIMEF